MNTSDPNFALFFSQYFVCSSCLQEKQIEKIWIQTTQRDGWPTNSKLPTRLHPLADPPTRAVLSPR